MTDFFRGLADTLRSAEAFDWRAQARANQLPPAGDWRIWLLLAGRGFGKALALDTPVATPSGWSTMGSLRDGDVVFDERGEPCRVVKAHMVQLGRPCFKVRFSDGAEIVADSDHLWMTEDHSSRKAAARAAKPRKLPQVRTTAEIRSTLYYAGREHNHSIPCAQPLQCPAAALPLDPYLLGYWLGNGNSSGAQITTMDNEVVRTFEAAGYAMHRYASTNCGLATTYGIVAEDEGMQLQRDGTTGQFIAPASGFHSALRRMGLLGAKRIPRQYLRASVCQRRALLQGLFDSDGYCAAEANGVEYTSINALLAQDVHELCLSLGYKATMSVGHATLDGRYISDKYRIFFTPNSAEPIFRVSRKLCRQRRPGAQAQRAHSRYIIAVDPVPSVPVRCITVDSPSHLYLAGREMIPTHNTRTVCEFVRAEVEAGRAARIALIAATSSDCRDVLVTGHSGLLAISPDWNRPDYQPTKRLLSWKNGAIATMYSADEPDRLRGPQFDLAICDELAAWRYPEALDMLLLGLRIGKNPRVAIATTPRPTKVIRDLLGREGRDVVVTRGSTLENRDNLAPAYIEQIIERYKGTRLERQEVFGEVLEDTPGALWNRDTLESTRVDAAPKDMQRIVVAIDPAGSSEEGADESGIIVAGMGQDGHAYVLEDLSGRYTPTEWARRALGAFHVWKADRIVCETNYGGEMVRATIEAVDPTVPVKPITSSRGKVLRAEPIAALFEQRKAHVIGSLPELEDQACRFTSDWTRARDGSPDRVDAMVFALSDLMLGLPAGGFFKEAMFLQDSAPAILTKRPLLVFAALGTPAPPSDSVAVIYLAKSTRPDAALTVLDWSIATHETALLRGSWLEDVARNLGGWSAATQSMNSGIWIERATPAGGALAELGAAHRLPVMDASDALKALPATLPERVALAAKYIGTGALVRLGAEAHAKAQTYRGLTRNHFLAQVCAYGSENAAPTEFVDALCLAVMIALNDDIDASRRLAETGRAMPHEVHGPEFSETASGLPAPQHVPGQAEQLAARVAAYEQALEEWQRDYQVELERQRKIGRNPKWVPPGGLLRGFRPRPQDPRSMARWI